MGWYTVTKTINGRKYLYLQMTYRVGRSVKTKNKYLGPATASLGSFGSGPDNVPTGKPQPTILYKPPREVKASKIKRFKKHPSLDSAYMKNSLRLIKNDKRREHYALLKYYKWRHGE